MERKKNHLFLYFSALVVLFQTILKGKRREKDEVKELELMNKRFRNRNNWICLDEWVTAQRDDVLETWDSTVLWFLSFIHTHAQHESLCRWANMHTLLQNYTYYKTTQTHTHTCTETEEGLLSWNPSTTDRHCDRNNVIKLTTNTTII